MKYTGNFYVPYDNSYCINCRNGKRVMLIPKSPFDLDYIGPDKEEENANFEIVCEPYKEDIYDYISHKNITHTFVNVISSKTGNLYRTLFNKCRVI